jgi:Pvc16 N-terminal domain
VSNYLALATVTATVARLVGEALEQIPNPSGIPRVRFGPPQADAQYVGCTIFMYRVVTNPYRRNEDLATRDDAGTFLQRPRATLDVDYLFTFAGEESTLEPQRFLGSVITALHAQPFLSRDAIRRTIAASSYLKGSDMAAQVGHIRLAPRDVEQTAMSQLWNTFPQVPYNISVAYTASAIVLEAQVTPREIPPVTEVHRTVEIT